MFFAADIVCFDTSNQFALIRAFALVAEAGFAFGILCTIQSDIFFTEACMIFGELAVAGSSALAFNTKVAFAFFVGRAGFAEVESLLGCPVDRATGGIFVAVVAFALGV